MARIRNPRLFSAEFGIAPATMASLGVFDPVLSVDSALFLDPLLLEDSRHEEISVCGTLTFNSYFESVLTLLAASEGENDLPWRSARAKLRFPEIRGTCLGYGSSSINGSAIGRETAESILRTAKRAVELGVPDPLLFPALVLLEEGVGADCISDMTTNVLMPCLVGFNARIIQELGVAAQQFRIAGVRGQFVVNPYQRIPTPVILVPSDILRPLPMASDRSEIDEVCSQNWQLRNEVNAAIGTIWERKTLKDKAKIKARALADRSALETLLKVVKELDGDAYDLDRDPADVIGWLRRATEAVAANPFAIANPLERNLSTLSAVVQLILSQFKDLVEEKGIWKEFRENHAYRSEKSAQRLFFAISDSYCKANNLDISPETDSGFGPVDFKFSIGYQARHLVEAKLSTNTSLKSGYQKQLEAYKRAETTFRATYLIIYLRDSDANRVEEVRRLRETEIAAGRPASDIAVVDARPRPSASNL